MDDESDKQEIEDNKTIMRIASEALDYCAKHGMLDSNEKFWVNQYTQAEERLIELGYYE